jgi:iron complex transport system substrate-binding protein
MRRRMAEVSERTKALPRPRLLYVLNSNPLMTVGPGSFIHQIIDLAGATNIAADAQTAYPRIAMEEVLRDDPEILLFPVGKEEGIPDEEQQQWLRWTRLSAVRHSRFVRIPSVLLDRPGPRIVDGLEQLARAIHPDAFAKDHP